VPRVAARTTASGVPEVRLTRRSYAWTLRPPTVPAAKASPAVANTASRSAAAIGGAWRSASIARATYSGGTRLSRAIGAPATSVTVLGTRVR